MTLVLTGNPSVDFSTNLEKALNSATRSNGPTLKFIDVVE